MTADEWNMFTPGRKRFSIALYYAEQIFKYPFPDQQHIWRQELVCTCEPTESYMEIEK